jgi:asparagine synthase (glutamine-hydrolysing)
LETAPYLKGLKKIRAGHALVVENGKIDSKKYWDLQESTVRKPEDEIAQDLRSILETATCLRMRADVDVGVFASGGVDSAAVTALANQYSEDVLHTFSIGFEHFSELQYA